jgi:hypothetical protein
MGRRLHGEGHFQSVNPRAIALPVLLGFSSVLFVTYSEFVQSLHPDAFPKTEQSSTRGGRLDNKQSIVAAR